MIIKYDVYMENQLTRLGQILIDLRKGYSLETGPVHLEYLQKEAVRIREQLMAIWTENPYGLAYVLEFHLVEAQRLFDSVSSKEIGQDFRQDLLEAEIFKMTVFSCIRKELVKILRDLRMMTDGERINLDLPDHDQ